MEPKTLFNADTAFEFVFDEQQIHCRYPNDSDLVKRQKATQTIMRTLNGGETVAERPDMDKVDEADVNLFNAIHLDEQMIVDTDTALRIVSILDNGAIKSCLKDGGNWVVKLRIMGGVKGAPVYDTVHTLRNPTFRDERRYRTLTNFRTLKGGRFKMETSLSGAGEMYDALVVKSEGYLGRIPVTHKHAVLAEVMKQVTEETAIVEEDSDGDGF